MAVLKYQKTLVYTQCLHVLNKFCTNVVINRLKFCTTFLCLSVKVCLY